MNTRRFVALDLQRHMKDRHRQDLNERYIRKTLE